MNRIGWLALVLLTACSHHDDVTTGDGGSPGDSGDGGDGGTPDGGIQADPDAYNLGMNAPAINYYNGVAIYADAALAFAGNNGPWDASSGDGAAALDATGAPTVAAVTNVPSDYPSGDYTLSWDGSGSISVKSGATLGAVTTTSSDGVQHNTATLTLVQTANNWFQLGATPPVTNIHLLAPAAATSASGVFVTAFVDRMRPFSTLRFMDALNTNGNTIQSWSQRTWPSEGSRDRPQGVAYEDIIALANETHKDVWINIPVLATDDYICRLARLFRYGEAGDKSDSACDPAAPAGSATTTPINSTSKIYIEYTNEIWNEGFQQWEDIYCMANGAPSSGRSCDVTAPTSAIASAALADTSLPWSTDANDKTSELSIVLAKRASDIWKQVFAGGAEQLRPIYNVQAAYPAEADPGFQFLASAYGSASTIFSAMAIAPYFDIDADSDADTLDDLFADLQTVLAATPPSTDGNAIANWLAACVTAAQSWGLPIVAYEGGQGLSGSTNQANKIAAQTDPRMYADYRQYFALWDAAVGRQSLFIHYSYVGAASQYGSWGALVSQASPGSQKWNALLSLSRLAGDADLDGSVTAADCAIVVANQGKTGQFWEQGDFNDDGTVDAADLAALNANLPSHDCAM